MVILILANCYGYLFFRYDYVQVFDGVDDLGSHLGVLTGGPPAPINSTGTDIFIRFDTDMSETRVGFRIGFMAV